MASALLTRTRALALGASLLGAACSVPRHTMIADAAADDVGPVDAPARTDAGTSIGVTIPWLDDGTPAIAAPQIDWLDRGAPDVAAPTPTCPSGWRPIPTSDVTASYCDPWPAAGRASCGPGLAHFPGEPDCAPVGRTCPAGDEPVDLPAGVPILHVSATAAAGGDGSAAAPFATISEAVAAAPSSAVIAIGRGTYDERVRIDHPLTLRGTCSAATQIVPTSGSETDGVLTLSADGIVIEDLAVGPSPTMGVVVERGVATLRGVVVAGVHGRGVQVLGGTVGASSVVVRDTAPLADGSRGRGVVASGGSSVTLDRIVVERSTDAALFANDGSSLVVHDAALLDVGVAPMDGTGGSAVALFAAGTRGTLARVVTERSVAYGLDLGPGTTLTADDVLVRGGGRAGVGGGMRVLATITVHRLSVVDVMGYGIVTRGASATVGGDDVIIDDVRGDSANPAIGLYVGEGAMLGLARVHTASLVGYAVFAESGGRVTLDDLAAHDIGHTGADDGAALLAQGSATLTVTRAVVEDVAQHGVYVYQGTSSLTDVVIRRVGADPTVLIDGLGALVGGTGTLSLTRVLVEDVRETGIAAQAGAHVVGADLVVRRVEPGRYDRSGGRGLDLDGAIATIDRAIVEDVLEIGVDVTGNADVTLQDVLVHHVRRSPRGTGAGRGMDVENSRVVVTRMRIEDVNECGAYVYADRPDRGNLVAEDFVVRDVLPQTFDLGAGLGLYVAGGGVSLERTLIERTHIYGMLASTGSAAIVATDVVVRDVAVAGCASMGCPESNASVGIGAYGGGHVSLSRFRVERISIGAQLASYGQLDLADGTIATAPIGINVQVAQYAFDRLTPLVRFEDVAVPLDAEYLPVPGLDVTR